MKIRYFVLFICLFTNPVFAAMTDIDTALVNVRESCLGISSELAPLKKMAGINTVITGAGTLAGGGAIATGFVKQSKDKSAEKIELELKRLREIQARTQARGISLSEVQVFEAEVESYYKEHKNDSPDVQVALEQDLEKLTKQSKNLGNWRTGLMAGSTATNVAGAIIAGGNKVKGDLKQQIDECKSAISDLRNSRTQARLNKEDATKITNAEQIIKECGEYDYLDISKINKRGDSAKWSSIVGATTGTAGTITSLIANTDKTRDDNTESGKTNEKNLNTASNVLAIGTTAASATATVFNASQISAIKKASEISDKCEEVLR